jgi:hypothetical protein
MAEREYLRVRPSTEQVPTEAIPPLLESLHTLSGEESTGRLGKLLPGGGSSPPRFEFLAVSEGAGEPVEFYYGTDGDLDPLADRLASMYPETFDVKRTEFDLGQRLIAPVEYDREAFSDRLDEGALYYEPDESALLDTESLPEARGDGGATAPDDGRQDGLIPETGPEADRIVECSAGDLRLAEAPPAGDRRSLTRPAVTSERTVLARPALAELEPQGVRWHGVVERKRDWMTTITGIDAQADMDDTADAQVPLARVVDHLVEATAPIAFQVVFQRKPDWSADAVQREHDIKHDLDTLRGKLRDFVDPTTPGEHDLLAPDRERLSRLDSKQPKCTFTVNARAVALPQDSVDDGGLESRLSALASSFDSLAGPFYEIEGRRLRDAGFRQRLTGQPGHAALERLFDRELVTGRGHSRIDLTLNAAELANLVTVPSGQNLSMEGRRGTGTKQASQTPLQRPDLTQTEAFHDQGGLAIGHALDETGTPESEPTYVPPALLRTHYGRFGTTGSGKSKALLNDALSLYEHTDGPVVLLDPKGDGLPENYLRAHAARFGVDDLEANVLHFPLPEILPGFTFFDLRPALADGTDRVDAIQRTADHYEEILKLVVGTDKYERASVAPTLIQALISVLFDSEYGRENGHNRESADYFAHQQLEYVLGQLWQAGPPDPRPEAAPTASDPDDHRRITRQLQLDRTTFSRVMGGVSNRLAYISQDVRLRQIFNNTDPRFDFRDILDEQTVVIFDLGELQAEPTKLLSGLILSNLEDALRDHSVADKPDEYVVNLLIDEAASVVDSAIVNRLLEQGRGFGLSVGLSMQFPEQIEEEGGRRLYLNTLNNIGTTLVGQVSVDREIAEAMAHEELPPREFKDRIASLPRGQWIAQVPSPTFGESGPKPFSVEPLPIPPGHPESDHPLAPHEEERVQAALETVHERSREEFGVTDKTATRRRATASQEVACEHTDEQPLDVAMARAVRAVQLSDEVRDTNGWVAVEDVDAELLSRVEDGDIEAQGYETLPEVREASPLIEVDLPDGGSSVQCRLTDEGEQAAKADTSTSPTGGGEYHDTVLESVERALAIAEFSVEVLDQTSESRPDAIATHSELDAEIQVEAETTTHTRPAKVLTNLRKAQEQERIPLFVVAGGDQSVSEIANRIANILDEPYNQLSSGETRLYTTNHTVTFNGGARAADGVTAVRPATGGNRHTRWVKRDEGLILEDGAGDQHARVDSFESVSKDQFPATYSYDAESDTHTVFRPGELPESYESREAFEADWVPVKRPFVPRTDLPVPEYAESSYVIGILTSDGESTLQLYTPATETTQDLSALVEAIQGGGLHPAGEDPTETEDDPFGIDAFVRDRITERDDEFVPIADVYAAYDQYVESRPYERKTKPRFTPAFREYTEFERNRKWVDGDVQRCYIGIELVDAGDQEESNDASA